MSASGTPTEHQVEDADHDGHHPTQGEYIRIALVLGLLTALEVSTYYFEFGRFGIPLLVILMVIKFIMVASFFMHLRYDTKLFGRFMYTGLAFALVLYAATLLIIVRGAGQ
jgi:cytochrome c oxidase subunit 4